MLAIQFLLQINILYCVTEMGLVVYLISTDLEYLSHFYHSSHISHVKSYL